MTFASFFTIASAKTDASIQNISGLPQGLAGPSALGWTSEKPSARAGRRR
jgi:hypothetical protein